MMVKDDDDFECPSEATRHLIGELRLALCHPLGTDAMRFAEGHRRCRQKKGAVERGWVPGWALPPGIPRRQSNYTDPRVRWLENHDLL